MQYLKNKKKRFLGKLRAVFYQICLRWSNCQEINGVNNALRSQKNVKIKRNLTNFLKSWEQFIIEFIDLEEIIEKSIKISLIFEIFKEGSCQVQWHWSNYLGQLPIKFNDLETSIKQLRVLTMQY